MVDLDMAKPLGYGHNLRLETEGVKYIIPLLRQLVTIAFLFQPISLDKPPKRWANLVRVNSNVP